LGMRLVSARRTVRPPTPESNTAMRGRELEGADKLCSS
jgi:hypothetical protein